MFLNSDKKTIKKMLDNSSKKGSRLFVEYRPDSDDYVITNNHWLIIIERHQNVTI
jgi:hypothetical protein